MEKVTIPEGTSGSVQIRRFEVTDDDAKRTALRAAIKRSPRSHVPPGWYTGLYRDGSLWMSDTPAEMHDHREASREIEKRGGRVLIMGLGIGLVVKHALALPQVEHVDVVEIDRDVINLVGPSYSGDRCTIHQGDAFTIKWTPGTRWNAVWHDVWQHITTDNLPEMTQLKRSYGRRADWQGCWAEDHLR